MVITSLDNKKIKKYLKLKQKKYRDTLKLFLIEGEHLVSEAIKSNYLVDLLVLEDSNLNFNFSYTIVSNNVMKKLSNMDSIPKVIGVCKFLNQSLDLGDKVLVLDDIQDPGNLGTIIRSALAFNVKDIILSKNTVDLYNDKVIRSSQGMIFKVNVIKCELKEKIQDLKRENYLIYGTDVANGVDVKFENTQKFVLIMGNEGSGVSPELKEICDKNLYIKMNSNVESLNVGVATSILLYELNR